jgi:O-antigen ligase
MRKAAWVLLVLFVFSIPWEYSLDFGAPWGNIARVLGLAMLLIAMLTALKEGGFRRMHELHWATVALFGWFCCTFFWTVTQHETLAQLRGYAQEMMLVWLVWEFAENREGLQILLRAWLAGSWMLAILTITSFVSLNAAGGEQSRFAPAGQDPNDVARYLAFGIPIAAILLGRTASRRGRLLLLAYLPVGFAGVLLTASRSGLLVAVVALAGCGVAAVRRHTKWAVVSASSVVLAATLILFAAPSGTLNRLSSTAELWQSGDLNQRVNIWSAGWRAFVAAPLIGHGAGSFATAAELAPEDTAHNTVLSILVE